MNPMLIAAIVTMVLLGGGCHRTEIIPERLEGKVDRDLRYADIKDNPQAYQGKLMLAGGQVLSALRKQDGTHIEVLQIPLSENLIPDGHESASKGRFVVIDYGSGQVTIRPSSIREIHVSPSSGKSLAPPPSPSMTCSSRCRNWPSNMSQYGTGIECNPAISRLPAMPTRMAGAMAASMGPAIIGNMGCLDRHFRREKLS